MIKKCILSSICFIVQSPIFSNAMTNLFSIYIVQNEYGRVVVLRKKKLLLFLLLNIVVVKKKILEIYFSTLSIS